ncbi:MAG: AAA family ATPase [Muribaculaceae bacterium]|nr:AAA family ATPase [Muribaculaceae bacterium]
MTLKTNPDFELALRIVENTDTNLFLTGRAGTGKTTFLHELSRRTRKQIVVAAPTGIAAINAGGVTLHSLFQLDFGLFTPDKERKPFKFSKAKLKLIRFMDLLVIDEVSMVRADLLDAVDDVLRRVRNPSLPFGGVQLLLIGDLRQLPPVVTDAEAQLLAEYYSTPYFFSSHALAQTNYVTVELQKVYRQEDEYFLELLGDVRGGHPSAQTIAAINKRYIPDFAPKESDRWVRLTSHNHQANAINSERMKALRGTSMTYKAEKEGNWPAGVFPAEEELTLKRGAQVMFVKNEAGPERRYFNGMIGTVSDFDEKSVTVAPDNGAPEIEVSAVEWENISYKVNETTGEVQETVDGVYRQIPLRTAWAITIHKSQGLTFSRAIIDASACFAHGQAYVALSRLRSIDGLVLNAPISASAIISDTNVNRFMEQQTGARPQEETLSLMELHFSLNLLNSIYDFSVEQRKADDLHRVVVDALGKTFPSVIHDYGRMLNDFSNNVVATGRTFQGQYTRLIATPDSRPMLTERLAKSAGYFPDKINEFVKFLAGMPTEIDNARLRKRFMTLHDELLDGLCMKAYLIKSMENTPFSNSSLMQSKRDFMLENDKQKEHASKKSAGKGKQAARDVNDDGMPEVKNLKLFRALLMWRRKAAADINKPAYTIITTKALINIANSEPKTPGALFLLKGCGPKTVAQWGQDLLRIVRQHSND